MIQTSVVSYFTDSSKIAAACAIISLIILKESFNNEQTKCFFNKEKDYSLSVNNICENRILYNFSQSLAYYSKRESGTSKQVDGDADPEGLFEKG